MTDVLSCALPMLIQQSIYLEDQLNKRFSSRTFAQWKPSQWCDFLETNDITPEAVAILICNNNKLKEYLIKWHSIWRHISSPLKGQDLLRQGWVPGPEVGVEIKRQRYKLIDNQCSLGELN